MGMLKRLKDLLSPPQPSVTDAAFEIPCGLTPPEWEDLKALTDARGWDAYLKALDSAAIFSAEALIGASKDESLHFYRGVITGLREAGVLIAKLQKSEAAYLDEQRRKLPTGRAGRTHATFGSAAWRARGAKGSQV